ncbi:MAG: ABC-type glycerol-3-phosphate transport system substrate-binding protein [Rhodoglobus sp.]|nr:ABC-type glycerol-3-phosphate transport system substrate-binding protein [Rhodoglobus sp.]
MKFSSKLAASAVVVGLGLTMSGCAGAPAADGPVTINYWSWDGAPGQDIVDQEIAAFEKANPDITVKYTEVPQADYKAKTALALSAGEDIDVVSVQPATWAQEVEGYLLPVADWSNGDAVLGALTPASVAQTSRLFTDKQLLAVPLYLTGSAIGIYNADILGELGVKPPQTWAEFKVLSDALKAQGKGILPAVMPGDGWFQDEVTTTIVGQTDPDFFNNVRYNGGAWNTPSYVKALTDYKALYDNGTLDTATLDLDYAGASTAFDEGKAAVLFNGSWETGRILTGNYGVIPFPAEDAANVSLRSYLDVTLAINKDSAEKDASAKFIQFLAAGDGVDIWASVLKGIPAVDGYQLPDGVLTTDLQKASYATIVSLLSNPHGDRNNLGAFSDAAGANTKEALLGHITPQQAADDSQAKLVAGNF